MVPPGNLTYFYSNHDDIFFTANDAQKLINTSMDKIIKDVVTYDGSKDVYLEKLNAEQVAKNLSLIQYN